MSLRAASSTFAAALMVLTMGCALTQSVVSVPPRPAVPDPAAGATVIINSVIDKRVFEESPTDASVATLKEGSATDKALTSRVVARKGPATGKPLGNVLLSPGQTVEGLVQEHLTAALREAGYRVAPAGKPAPAGALPMDVDIRTFWAWFEPGFWFITVNFKGILDVTSPALKNGGRATLTVRTDKGYQAVLDGDWASNVQAGGAALGEKLKENLKPAN